MGTGIAGLDVRFIFYTRGTGCWVPPTISLTWPKLFHGWGYIIRVPCISPSATQTADT
jgi:hypothetical protein